MSSQKYCFTCKDDISNVKACGQCFKVYYCSAECQKSDWKRHRPECRSALLGQFLSRIGANPNDKVKKKQASLTCTFCGSRSGPMKKCLQCQSAQYCSKECQKSHWKKHKDFCIAKMTVNDFVNSPESFKNITEDVIKIATRIKNEDRCNKLNEDPQSVDVNREWKTIQKVGFQNSQGYLKRELRAGRSLENTTCRAHDIDSAVEVAKEMYPNKKMLTYLKDVPMELAGKRQEHSIFVGLMVSWHQEMEQHGMFLVDASDMTSFVFINTEKVPNPRPHFYWSDLNPGNFVLIKRPFLRVFKNSYLGFSVENAEDLNIIISQPCMINRLGKNQLTVALHHGSQDRRLLSMDKLYEMSEDVDDLIAALEEELDLE